MDQHTPRARKSRTPEDAPARRATFTPTTSTAPKKSTLAGRVFGAGRKHRGRKNTLAVLGIAAACTLGVTATGLITTFSVAESAFAATHGYGYQSEDGDLGGYTHNGIQMYCLQITAAPPIGNTTAAGNVQYAAMSKDENARVNKAVTEFGQRADNNWAAATHLYVWSVADAAEYNSHGMSGDDYYVARAPADQRADILNKLAYIRQAVASTTAASSTATGGSINLDVDPTNNYLGKLTVVLPAGFSGPVTLTKGVETETGSNLIASVGGGTTVFNVRGTPAEDEIDYKISASVSAEGPGGYAGQIGLYKTPGQQDLAAPGPKGTSRIELSTADPATRSTLFSPAVGTKVSSVYVAKGERLCDVKELFAAPNKDGRVNEWPKNSKGVSAPVTVRTSVWGPEKSAFAEAAKPGPQVTLHEAGLTYTGSPDKPVEVCADKVVQESGYYTWWDEIYGSDSTAGVSKRFEGGTDYLYQAVFGQAVETSIVPMDLQFESKIQKPKVMIGDTNTDKFNVSLRDGAYMTENGRKIDVVYEHTVRYSATDPALEVGQDAPEHTEVLATLNSTVNDIGQFDLTGVPAGYKAGWVNVQTCSRDADPDQARVKRNCDLYGLPAETFQVYEPDVATSAQTDSTGAKAKDLFDVTAPFDGAVMPKGGILVSTTGHHIPDGSDEHVCTADTQVPGVQTSEPILVTDWGQFETEWFDVPKEYQNGGIQFVEDSVYAPKGEDLWNKPGDCTNLSEYTPVGKPELPVEETPSPKPTAPAPKPQTAAPVAKSGPAGLAETGADLTGGLIMAGAAIIGAAGVGTYLLLRRRKEAPTATDN